MVSPYTWPEDGYDTVASYLKYGMYYMVSPYSWTEDVYDTVPSYLKYDML